VRMTTTDLSARETKTKASKEASPSLSQAMYASQVTIASIKKGDRIAVNPEMPRELGRKEQISVTKKIVVMIVVMIAVINVAVISNKKETRSKVKLCMNLS